MRLGSSFRACSAADTWARVAPLMAGLGVSRVTDITRMDHLGVPVYASVRPRGRTLRVHAGKGLTPAEARIGALMEAAEYAVAEAATVKGPDLRLPLGELAAALPGGLLFTDFAPRLDAELPARRVIGATRCDHLRDGSTCLLPWELFAVPLPEQGDALFGWSGNGLASGNTLEEASLHALFEVLERDAEAMNLARDESIWIDPASWPEPFASWRALWQPRGIELIVRRLPNDFGLPCFGAWLHDTTHHTLRVSSGSGLHTDPGVALARAVCEAAQSRLTFIQGGWDHVTYRYQPVEDAEAERAAGARLLAQLYDRTRSMPCDATPWARCSADDPAEVLKALLHELQARGWGDVFRHHYPSAAATGFHVVRVVVARCELANLSGVRMGPRLFARATGREQAA